METKTLRELKKILTDDNCTFSTFAMAYVSVDENGSAFVKKSATKNILNLEKEERHKYFAFMQKMFGGVDKKLFLTDIDNNDSIKLLQNMSEGNLSTMLAPFLERLCELYIGVEQFAVFIACGNYDVPIRTSDNIKNDESDIVYPYVFCTINPIQNMTSRIICNDDIFGTMPVIKEVKEPLTGFIYPDFDNGACDYNKAMLYFAKPEEDNLIAKFFNNVEICDAALRAVPVKVKRKDSLATFDTDSSIETNTAAGDSDIVTTGEMIYSPREDDLLIGGYIPPMGTDNKNFHCEKYDDGGQPSNNDIITSVASIKSGRYTRWRSDGSAIFTTDPVRCANRLAKYEDIGTLDELKKIKEANIET